MDVIATAYENEQELQEQFEAVLIEKKVRTVFQPILSLRDGSVIGYEALSRGPEQTPMQSPSLLFDFAHKSAKTWELESLCRAKAIETASQFGFQGTLFLNVNPMVMHDEKFREGFTREYLQRYKIDPENIVFEITEKGSVTNMDEFSMGY